VGGKIAQLGQRLIDSAAAKVVEDFFKRFDEEASRRCGATQAAVADAITAPVSMEKNCILVWIWDVDDLLISAIIMYMARV
jgi:uncharacterized protein